MRGQLVIEDFETAADWTAITDSTTTLAVSTASLYGTNCMSFAKVSQGETYGGIHKTLTSFLTMRDPWMSMPFGRICWTCVVSATTNVAYAFIRLGKYDADGVTMTNYLEWRYDDDLMAVARYNQCWAEIGEAYVAGTGINWDDIDFMAVGVEFDAHTHTLAAILVDHAFLIGAAPVST